MTHPYEAIFFDLDGTLFDLIACERETLRRLLSQTLPSFGPTETERLLAAYAKVSPGHWASGLATDNSREEIVGGILAAVCAQTGVVIPDPSHSTRLYWQIFANVAVLEEGAVEVLKKLSASYRLGVISNGYADTQRPRLAAAGLTGYFEAIVVSGEVGWAKPDPRIFAHALGQMSVTPSAALYVGDSASHDLAGALAAGVDFCLYRPKGGTGLELPAGVLPAGVLPADVLPADVLPADVRLVTALSQLAALLT